VPGAAVDQLDLAEVVARAEGGDGDALVRDRSLPGVDEEERGAAGALHDDGLCARTALEQRRRRFNPIPVVLLQCATVAPE